MGWKVCYSNSKGENILMMFTETNLQGSFIIDLEKINDERGYFTRVWDKKEFEDKGLDVNLSQCSISYNKKQGTLRGMHYQICPYEEVKIVQCIQGSIFDVIIDLRKNSKTCYKWFGIELSENSYKCLYIPKGFAHGFETLEDNTKILYQMSGEYNPKYAKGICWDDKFFQINWPLTPTIMSKRDQKYKKLVI
jgi:dTDP-4-dehydrorhamnose 3,5-epimerase